MRKPEVQATVEMVGRIYDLVEEINEIVNHLNALGVVARFGGRPRADDPLARDAVVELTMRTTMEPLSERG